MRNLKVWQKLALMGLILLIPFAVVLWQLVSSTRALNIEPAEREIQGVEYITQVRKLMREVQMHRAVSAGALRGESGFRDRLSTQRVAVGTAIIAVDKADAQWGASLAATQKWQSLKESINTLINNATVVNNATPVARSENIERHNVVVNELIAFTQHIGDTSTLTLDPELACYYLMNIIVFRQPVLSEKLGQSRAVGMEVLARKRVTRAEDIELLQLDGAGSHLVNEIEVSLRKTIAEDTRLSGKFSDVERNVITASRNYLRLLQAMPTAPGRISGTEYYNAATKAIDATYQISDEASPALKNLLRERIDRLEQQLLYTMLWAILGLLAVAAIGIFLIRDITHTLDVTVGIAKEVASGNLHAKLPTEDRRDELGDLVAAFSSMTDSLRSKAKLADEIAAGNLSVEFRNPSEHDTLGHSLYQMLEQLRTMTGNISQAVNQLGASSSEILASTSQLSASAAETASAITETTTTVEEVRQTAHVSNEKAQLVAQTAQAAAQTAQEGKESTEQSTLGMQRIREQMEAIAQSMIRLSEQSAAIGEIISSVDDLTQQSNLLAVNAAIEAAKAGEQGKGFAVVAGEVKNLAEQSRLATAQVRTILSDIQKATAAAVMATEQGTKVVETGALQSSQAGESIVQLAESIEETTQASVQIAASSQQQLVGVDQVAIAMDSVRQASLQNVDSAHQLESAAKSLNSLGLQLRELIAQYRI